MQAEGHGFESRFLHHLLLLRSVVEDFSSFENRIVEEDSKAVYEAFRELVDFQTRRLSLAVAGSAQSTSRTKHTNVLGDIDCIEGRFDDKSSLAFNL